MKLKLVDISRDKKTQSAQTRRAAEGYSLAAVFADTPLVDLKIYRELLGECAARGLDRAAKPRLTNSRF